MTGPEIPLGYIAGIIDARGHIEVQLRHGTQQPRLSVTTRRLALLEHLAQLTGTNVSIDNRGYERRPCGEHCSEAHSHVVRQSAKWRVDSSRATIVLYNVVPLLVSQRAEALAALRIGLQAYPARRGNTADQMSALGWALPEVQESDVAV